MLTLRPNPYWTIEEADQAVLAEVELIKLTAPTLKPWPLSEIEREYQLYDTDTETTRWPES